MPISKLQFKPGIHREGTTFSEGGAWYDCDKVRFRSGFPEKIGGWVRASTFFFKGVARIMWNWILLDGKDCLAIGTSKKFYIETSGIFYDTTPIRQTDTKTDPITTSTTGAFIHTYVTTNPHNSDIGDNVVLSNVANFDGLCTSTYTNPFTTTSAGSPIITVDTVTPHFAKLGETVTFSGTTGFDSIPASDFNTAHVILEIVSLTAFTITVATNATTAYLSGGGSVTAVYLSRLNREFEVLTIPTSTSFTFQTDFPATTGAVVGGGVGVVASFIVSIGQAFNSSGGGWGSGTWSRGTWSSGFAFSAYSARLWSVDNFGEDLVFCIRESPIFYWDATGGLGSRGVFLNSLVGASDVPTTVTLVMVTDERHVVAVGCTDRITTAFDPLLIRWSDQEDPLNWTPAITNTSGAQRIPMGSYTVAAIQARQETLIWTDRSLHSLQYNGAPFTFGLITLAESTNIIGPNAAVNVNNVTYWMGRDRFWVYSGRVEAMPCSIQRYIFEDINQVQASAVYAAANDAFQEVTWFYCGVGSDPNNKYVTYNYGAGVWSYGTMSRTAWAPCPGRGSLPYATDLGYADDDGSLFVHESGNDDGSTNPPSPITAFIQSADFGVGDGDKLIFADRIIPDFTFERSTIPEPSLQLTVDAKKFPGQIPKSADTDERAVSAVTSEIDQYTEQVWARLRGRQMRIKVTSTGLGVAWLMGTLRINIRLDGRQ